MKKVIVISGGSSGLGKSIAKKLTKENVVVILSHDKEKIASAAREINCDYEVCDVRSYENCEQAVKRVVNKLGRIDCLINSAGLWIEGKLEENNSEKIQEVFEVNTLGTIFLTKAAVTLMKGKNSGLVINVISQAGFYARVERSVYTATKWAITGFTKAIQPELASYGIGITGLYPGMIQTELFEKAGVKKDMSNGLNPAEIARVVEFLLSFPPTTIFPEIGIKNINN